MGILDNLVFSMRVFGLCLNRSSSYLLNSYRNHAQLVYITYQSSTRHMHHPQIELFG